MDDSEFSEVEDEAGEEEEEELDPSNPQHYFAFIENDFNRTLSNLEQNPEAAQYADDFSKLFDAFYQAYTKQKQLEDTTDNMGKEIDFKNTKLDAAITLANEDKKTIDQLKAQIQRAWKLADAAHLREQLAQEVIDNLRRQVENLNKEIEFKNKLASMDQDEEDVTKSKQKDGLERERDRLLNEVTQLSTKLNNAMEYQHELEKKNSDADLKMNEIAGQLEDTAAEVNRQKRVTEQFEMDIQNLHNKLEEKDTAINDLNGVISNYSQQVALLEHDIKEDKDAYEKLVKELESTIGRLAKVQADYDKSLKDGETVKENFQLKLQKQKGYVEEVKRLRKDVAKLNKTNHSLEKKITGFLTEKDQLIVDRDELRQIISTFQREMEELKKSADEDRRAMDTMSKEKDLLKKTIQKQQMAQKEATRLMAINDQSKKKLEAELDTNYTESGKQRKQIIHLERERDRLVEEQLDLNKTIQENEEDIRLKKTQISDMKRQEMDYQNKLRQQNSMYETMRTERNALQKAFQESGAECDELKKKLKIALHQTEQLKEDIVMKEKLLIKDENVMRKLNKEKENLKIEVMSGLNQIKNLRAEIKEVKDEGKRLHKTIMENDKTIRDQAKTIDQLMNERDVLGSQLVRRNDEISLLNEKIVILQTTMARGEAHYDQRLNDIKLLKLEVRRLRQEKNVMSKTISNTLDLRQEIFHLERELTQSRLQCKALEQEMQNPLNIHRWRKLEGSDPEVVDLLQKVQILQRRLLHKASEAVERERQLKEAERLYLNLKQVLSKQPGPGLQDELTKTQRALKTRGDKLKSLVSELNMAELKSVEYKSDLQRVTDELADLKRKYLAEKKANRARRMAFETSREINHNRGDAGDVKFTGGGFRMSVQQISTK